MRKHTRLKVTIAKTTHKYFMTEEPPALEVLKNYRAGKYGNGGKH